MYITQEIPIIQNKMVYFVGASDLEINTETKISDLILSLKGFLYSLENQNTILSELSENELDTLYNQIYQSMQDFVKIQKKMQFYNYFGNNTVRTYFDSIIVALKQVRKDLLKIIEGDLVVGVQKLTQTTISKRLNTN